MSQRTFLLRIKGRVEQSLAQNVIGIGWSEARTLKDAETWDDLKLLVNESYPGYSSRGLGNVCGSMWQFFREMREGDQVLVPLPNSAFRVAKLLDDHAYYDEAGASEDYAWKRRVTWTPNLDIPRSHANNRLQKRMKCMQTCIDITDLSQDVTDSLARTGPVSFKNEFYAEIREHTSKHLLSSLNSTQIEELVAQILRGRGWNAKRLHTVQDKAGDIDVRAEMDLGIGVEAGPITIGIQIKQHEGVTDKYAVQQIEERMKEANLDRGIVITTARDFDEDAKSLAAELSISLVSMDEFAEWVLDNSGFIEA